MRPQAPPKSDLLAYLKLGAEACTLAIRAHQEECRVRCLGRLVKEGRTLVLREPHRLELDPGE